MIAPSSLFSLFNASHQSAGLSKESVAALILFFGHSYSVEYDTLARKPDWLSAKLVKHHLL